jgi:hypothetical protein
MKRKIGIIVIIVLNVAALLVMGGLTGATYGIITGSAGRIHAEAATNEVTNEILVRLSYIVALVAALNYWILKTVVFNKKPFVTTFILLILYLIIYIPFLLFQKRAFFKRQSEPDYFNHYYDRFAIDKAIVITPTDTIEIKELNDFTWRLWAKHTGPIKYKKTMKLIFINNDGTSDTIPTNGQIFGSFKGNYFKADENIIDDYLRRHN